MSIPAPANRPPTKKPTDLEVRVASRKAELISEIIEHKKSLRVGAHDSIDQLKGRLAELAHILTEALADGWSNVSKVAKLRLEDWIAR